jgi:hypothetical protein
MQSYECMNRRLPGAHEKREIEAKTLRIEATTPKSVRATEK